MLDRKTSCFFVFVGLVDPSLLSANAGGGRGLYNVIAQASRCVCVITTLHNHPCVCVITTIAHSSMCVCDNDIAQPSRCVCNNDITQTSRGVCIITILHRHGGVSH